MNLGENIYRLRTRKNMSQGDLAEALDVSRQSVSKWENNSAVPELDKLVKMRELFGVTLDELISANYPQLPDTPPAPQKSNLQLRHIIGIILFVFTLILFLLLFLIPHLDSASWLALICSCILLTTSVLAYEHKFACGICLFLCVFSLFMLLCGSESRFNLWFSLFSTPVALIWGCLRLRDIWKNFDSNGK